jgi:hypothetical protein
MITKLRMFLLIALTILLSSIPHGSSYAFDMQRAQANYQAIITGQKTIGSLPEEQQTEVYLLMQALRNSAPSGASSDCEDAWDNASSSASDVASYAKRLIRCVEGGDYHDDCYSEFRRVKSAHSDYESAASEVGSYCN